MSTVTAYMHAQKLVQIHTHTCIHIHIHTHMLLMQTHRAAIKLGIACMHLCKSTYKSYIYTYVQTCFC